MTNNFWRHVSLHDRKPKTRYVTGYFIDPATCHPLVTPGRFIYVYNGKNREPLEPSRDRRNPLKEVKTFDWGENTPEAEQLAYTLLRVANISEKRAIGAYQAFTEEVIAMIRLKTWVIEIKDVKRWVKAWEAEQAYLAEQAALAPKSTAPRSMPFYGTNEPMFLELAHERLTEFLALAPADPDAHSAMAYLELATNLAEARKKTVNSIWWSSARAAAKNEIWAQLLLLESQIVFNLTRFGEWWDVYSSKLESFPVVYPLPDYLTPEKAELVNYQGHKRGDLYSSLRTIQQYIEEMSDRQMRYQPFLLKHAPEIVGDVQSGIDISYK